MLRWAKSESAQSCFNCRVSSSGLVSVSAEGAVLDGGTAKYSSSSRKTMIDCL